MNNTTTTTAPEELTFIGNYDADEALEIFTNTQSYWYWFSFPKPDGTVDVFRGEHD